MTPKRKYGTHQNRPGFMVYLGKEEKEEISKATRGEKISAFIRRAALKEARAVLAEEPE
jgi:hypothetical protein